jgi:hypothetical protein
MQSFGEIWLGSEWSCEGNWGRVDFETSRLSGFEIAVTSSSCREASLLEKSPIMDFRNGKLLVNYFMVISGIWVINKVIFFE